MSEKLAEMWVAMQAYQPKADADGHGASWAKMCRLRTADAAWDAWSDAWSAPDMGKAPAAAAVAASWALAHAPGADNSARIAINALKGVKP